MKRMEIKVVPRGDKWLQGGSMRGTGPELKTAGENGKPKEIKLRRME